MNGPSSKSARLLRSEYPDPERLNRLIEFSGDDAVAVMEQELIPVIYTAYLAQLLQRPRGGGMGCEVAVDEATTSMLDDHEHVQHAEARRDGEAEITGDEWLGNTQASN